jgi:hypothetical protein
MVGEEVRNVLINRNILLTIGNKTATQNSWIPGQARNDGQRSTTSSRSGFRGKPGMTDRKKALTEGGNGMTEQRKYGGNDVRE